jgi:hypothetical protein
MTGQPPRSDYRPKVQKLTELEEGVIVNYIIDLDSRGFSPWLADVEDIANYLLETHQAKRVGRLWAHRFVQRRLELKIRLNCVYDYQRALCKDPKLIGIWFRLVENI